MECSFREPGERSSSTARAFESPAARAPGRAQPAVASPHTRGRPVTLVLLHERNPSRALGHFRAAPSARPQLPGLRQEPQAAQRRHRARPLHEHRLPAGEHRLPGGAPSGMGRREGRGRRGRRGQQAGNRDVSRALGAQGSVAGCSPARPRPQPIRVACGSSATSSGQPSAVRSPTGAMALPAAANTA